MMQLKLYTQPQKLSNILSTTHMCSNLNKQLCKISTGGERIHWSTSIPHTARFTRTVHCVVYLHSTYRPFYTYCTPRGLPPFHIPPVLHVLYTTWSTSIPHTARFTRTVHRVVYLHSTYRQFYTYCTPRGLPPFNMPPVLQVLYTAWSTSIPHTGRFTRTVHRLEDTCETCPMSVEITSFARIFVFKYKTRMTTRVLKQDPNTYKVQKNAVY